MPDEQVNKLVDYYSVTIVNRLQKAKLDFEVSAKRFCARQSPRVCAYEVAAAQRGRL